MCDCDCYDGRETVEPTPVDCWDCGATELPVTGRQELLDSRMASSPSFVIRSYYGLPCGHTAIYDLDMLPLEPIYTRIA